VTTLLIIWLLVQSAPIAEAPAFDQLSRQAADARQENRNDDALRLYRLALAMNPSWADGRWNVGSILYEKEQYADARDEFLKLIGIDSQAVAGYAMLGICEYKIKDYDAALRHLDAARLLGLPKEGSVAKAAQYYLAVLLNKTGLHDAATEVLLGLSQADDASSLILEALGLAGLRITTLPEDATGIDRELARTVGQALATAGHRRAQESLRVLENLIKLHPTQLNLHYLCGIVLLQEDGNQAIEEFERELTVQPDSIHTLLAIGQEMERTQRLEEARGFAERAVRAGPSNFDTHALLGRILVSEGRLQEGAAELERARAIDSGSPQVYFALASAYARLGRNEDAERARAEFLRLKKIVDGQQ
jgi:predicted Zn-dependent protease